MVSKRRAVLSGHRPCASSFARHRELTSLSLWTRMPFQCYLKMVALGSPRAAPITAFITMLSATAICLQCKYTPCWNPSSGLFPTNRSTVTTHRIPFGGSRYPSPAWSAPSSTPSPSPSARSASITIISSSAAPTAPSTPFGILTPPASSRRPPCLSLTSSAVAHTSSSRTLPTHSGLWMAPIAHASCRSVDCAPVPPRRCSAWSRAACKDRRRP